ncbi:cation transporter [Nocardioides sp. ChNu-153]|uniref:cation diffusion facilitator family transporter n=1 Tax=unclassified Nocardioides TaxID=2615069 RepID=UPI002406B922|nr:MULTISPECIES: cation diffusion facilitator family transporter [unclassified Nocardioides]MDF9715181.1 cation diffusion facilitator family transporter [Nocardioides sp. ChNu-99]MDN7121040.1 cation transporter [Nocardioides sp. ChNu-153]
MGHGHGHGHGGPGGHGAHGAGRAADRRRLRIVLAVTGSIMVLQAVGGLLTGSLALVADSAHMAMDAGGVLLALGASYVAARPAGERSTFGYHRAEVVAALANAVVLLGLCAVLLWFGASRLVDPGEVDAGPMILFALSGLVANGVSMAVLSRSDTGSLNLRGALMEVVADLLGSVFAIAAGVVILVTGWQRADPVASLLIAVMILPRAVSLARDALRVLLEVAPDDLDLAAVTAHIRSMDGVLDVHDLHAWTITSGLPSLSAHVTVTEEALAQHGVGGMLDRISHCVAEHFEVRHATFQIEPATHRAHEDLGEAH